MLIASVFILLRQCITSNLKVSMCYSIDAFSDDQLVNMYIHGDNSAFESLLLRCKEKVYFHIFNMVRNDEIANDIFQETFIKVIVNIRNGKYTDNGKFCAWVIRIAHNLVIDHFRKVANDNLVSYDDENKQNVEGLISLLENNVQDEILHQDTLKEVEKLMFALPENQKEIVYMRFYQDMSFKEIAESLDISINTALGRMRYAVLNMKKMALQHAYFN